MGRILARGITTHFTRCGQATGFSIYLPRTGEFNVILKELDMDNKQYFITMAESNSTIQRILAQTWLDADRGDWPKYNQGQRKALIEEAFREFDQITSRSSGSGEDRG